MPGHDDDYIGDMEQPHEDRTPEESIDHIADVYDIEEWQPGWTDDHADGE